MATLTLSLTPVLSLESLSNSPMMGGPLAISIPSDLPEHEPTPPHSPHSSSPSPCPTPTEASTVTPPPSPTSLLYPIDEPYTPRQLGTTTVYELDAAAVAAAMHHRAGQPLPDPAKVFPWLHGLHPGNHLQQAFFTPRRSSVRKAPPGIRGIAIVRAGGDLSRCRLKGAIGPDEFVAQAGKRSVFKEVDPREGFSVRNFQIQAAKYAALSDVIVYGDDAEEVLRLAKNVAHAQQSWREEHIDPEKGVEVAHFNTFVCTSPFSVFEQDHPDLVAMDSQGRRPDHAMDFFFQERIEMCTMTRASEIHHNVWLGPSPDPALDSSLPKDDEPYDILIECSDSGRLRPRMLQALAEGTGRKRPISLEFPSSGSIMPPTWSHTEADGILETCKWIYHIAHGIPPPAPPRRKSVDRDGDVAMTEPKSSFTAKVRQRRILIHCTDGYTESTFLALAYYTYATGLSIPDAWLSLHMSKGRNFFAYPSDVALLTAIAPRLLVESPAHVDVPLSTVTEVARHEPEWMKNMDGSLPSRIVDYMYLGNLGHANNPELLRELGIRQILSVGETATWKEGALEKWGAENVMLVQQVQDNGIDPLTGEFERCLEFIERGKARGVATLVHCRVGVSRSATICIAEVMRTTGLSFPRAYCFVRARRLNVIIQPHLRFSYELLKWEEKLKAEKSPEGKFRRELEWPEIAREIAAMNWPYAR